MLKLSSFRRITSGGNFIPEIDGLRFVAIISVILCHLCALLAARTIHDDGREAFDQASQFLIRGRFGVQLFFVISGLILGIPFCRKRISGDQNLQLKSYYLRRLTRIEPPYVLVMIVLFFASVYIAHSLDFQKALNSLIASLLYSHNFVYGRHVFPYLTTVAWSLEIEIQFYLLVPLISLVFLIKPVRLRRMIMVGIMILFTFLSDWAQFSFISLYDFIQYFMAGFLLADFYCHRSELKPVKYLSLSGYLAFLCIWLFDSDGVNNLWQPFWHLAQLFFVFWFYYAVLFGPGFRWLKKELIVVIGGMCYSIYLLHYPLISLFGNFLVQFKLTGNTSADNFIFTFIIFLLIITISAIFFIAIERPCMKRDWYKHIFRKRQNSSTGEQAVEVI